MNRSLFLTSFACLCLGVAGMSLGADVELSVGMELVFTANGNSRTLTITEVDTTSDPAKTFIEGDADFDVAGGRPTWTDVDIVGHFTGFYVKTGDQIIELDITNPAGRVIRRMEGQLEEAPVEEDQVIAVLTTYDTDDEPTTVESDYVYEP